MWQQEPPGPHRRLSDFRPAGLASWRYPHGADAGSGGQTSYDDADAEEAEDALDSGDPDWDDAAFDEDEAQQAQADGGTASPFALKGLPTLPGMRASLSQLLGTWSTRPGIFGPRVRRASSRA